MLDAKKRYAEHVRRTPNFRKTMLTEMQRLGRNRFPAPEARTGRVHTLTSRGAPATVTKIGDLT